MQAKGQDLLEGRLLGVGQAWLGKAAGHYGAHESRSAVRVDELLMCPTVRPDARL